MRQVTIGKLCRHFLVFSFFLLTTTTTNAAKPPATAKSGAGTAPTAKNGYFEVDWETSNLGGNDYTYDLFRSSEDGGVVAVVFIEVLEGNCRVFYGTDTNVFHAKQKFMVTGKSIQIYSRNRDKEEHPVPDTNGSYTAKGKAYIYLPSPFTVWMTP